MSVWADFQRAQQELLLLLAGLAEFIHPLRLGGRARVFGALIQHEQPEIDEVVVGGKVQSAGKVLLGG